MNNRNMIEVMPKLSKYQQKKVDELKDEAFILYRRGRTTRQIGKTVGRSHGWVSQVVRELEGEYKLNKTEQKAK